MARNDVTNPESTTPQASLAAVKDLWRSAGLPESDLDDLDLTGQEPALPSSFALGTAAQATMAAVAAAAASIHRRRTGASQRIAVDMRRAASECCDLVTIDGKPLEPGDPLTGLYPCGEGQVRIHANFAHHRDGALRLLGLPEGGVTRREDIADALTDWNAVTFEQEAAQRGLAVAALRDHSQWLAHPQGRAIEPLATIRVERIGEASPRPWPNGVSSRPLQGLRILDLTRILAGPVACRALAAHGADVLMINSPNLPNIDSIADLSRGKRSALLDLRNDAQRRVLAALIREADAMVQGYRPGALAALGFAPEDLAELNPGIVCASLSAYGETGPWGDRRGFDSLVQTASGFNVDEGIASGRNLPQPFPAQLLDHASGQLLAFGTQAALLRQREQGGSWLVRVCLAGTGRWLRDLGRVAGGFEVSRPSLSSLPDAWLQVADSEYGRLRAMTPTAQLSVTPAFYARPSHRPGSDAPRWSS